MLGVPSLVVPAGAASMVLRSPWVMKGCQLGRGDYYRVRFLKRQSGSGYFRIREPSWAALHCRSVSAGQITTILTHRRVLGTLDVRFRLLRKIRRSHGARHQTVLTIALRSGRPRPPGIMSRGRLSPVPPPRAPSPGGSTKNSLARQASPISDVPRPSISSNRSMKRSEADFEAALLNPTKTIFLKGSPVLDEDEGFGSPRRLGVISGDVDAPVPVEKRSYEDDLRQLGRSSLDRGAGSSGTMVSNNIKGGQASFDVIPPTPSPKKTLVNRTSHRTMESQDSGTSTMSPSRMSQISASSSSKRIASQSLGIDGELVSLLEILLLTCS